MLAPFFVEGRAAHTFFHIVGSPIGIFDDRHHDVVVFRDKHIPLRDIDLALIDLGARLVKALLYVVEIEYHIIGRGLADDTDNLTLFIGNAFPVLLLITDSLMTFT